eukprot:NODE_63_length_25098_cov_0.440498.p20 type:complete len:105 gc:universal NODE_63_length_25098_cov_0.440498:9871-10185(+)
MWTLKSRSIYQSKSYTQIIRNNMGIRQEKKVLQYLHLLLKVLPRRILGTHRSHLHLIILMSQLILRIESWLCLKPLVHLETMLITLLPFLALLMNSIRRPSLRL